MGREVSGEADECAQQSGHGSAVEPAALGCLQVGKQQQQRPRATDDDTAVRPSPLSTPANDDGHAPRTITVVRLEDSRRETATDTCSMGLTCFKSWKYDSTTQKGEWDAPGHFATRSVSLTHVIAFTFAGQYWLFEALLA